METAAMHCGTQLTLKSLISSFDIDMETNDVKQTDLKSQGLLNVAYHYKNEFLKQHIGLNLVAKHFTQGRGR